jgi:virulence-associated protein VagC
MKEAGSMRTVTLTEAEFKGSYRVVERREDGTLVLQPQPEKLSQVVAETDGQVFRDEEFIAHLERVEAAEDDIPADQRASAVPIARP